MSQLCTGAQTRGHSHGHSLEKCVTGTHVWQEQAWSHQLRIQKHTHGDCVPLPNAKPCLGFFKAGEVACLRGLQAAQ